MNLIPIFALAGVIIALSPIISDAPARSNMCTKSMSPSIFSESFILPPDTSYSAVKKSIQSIKANIDRGRITDDSLSHLFTSLLTEKIIPHWLGTPWSFECHTSVPKTGNIACGYFVSTTLLDMGFKINKYKLAQQLPVHEAMTLNLGEPLIEISDHSSAVRIRQLQNALKEGIYFIGFDQSHVGYIQKKNGNLFVIHSNYIGAEGVVIEPIETSQVFDSYQHLYIAEISSNKALLRKWLNNEVIQVISQ